MNPLRVILLSYLALVLLGTLLFYLTPATERELPFTDILFTVTSAVTVTGLTVVDLSQELTPWGKFLIMLLIQVGGLGYMTLTTFFLIVLGRRIGIRERKILAESLNYPGLYGLIRFLKRVMLFALIFESLGALLLFVVFVDSMDPARALFMAVFHAVSAFNNAGFSFVNIEDHSRDLLFTATLILLIICGGIGFYTVNDIYMFLRRKVTRVSTHTRIVLFTSGLLILLGFVGILLLELGNKSGLGGKELTEMVINALFLSVSSRTAGFSPVDLSSLSESSQFLLMILMFIGASPGGTGGGIKVTTFAVVFLAVLSYIRSADQIVIFRRSVPERYVKRAMVILSLSVMFVTFINLLIDKVEEKDFLKTMFEVVSAFSTTGLSLSPGTSFCSDFSDLGKLLIIVTMIAGRIGVLGFAISLLGERKRSSIKYPEGKILI